MNNRIFSFGSASGERRASQILFFIGLFASTQIYIGGYTAISELLLVAALPFMFIKNYQIFVRDNCLTILVLLIFWCVGVCVTDLTIHNSIPAFIRGLIPPVGILASVVVFYPILRKWPMSFRWFFFGFALSNVLSIFIFQHGSDIGRTDVQAGLVSGVDAVMQYKLFWLERGQDWLSLPVRGWYLDIPVSASVALCFSISVFALYSGGRSSFASWFVSMLFVVIAGKNFDKMRKLSKSGVGIVLAVVVSFWCIQRIYKSAATSGWMGEKERIKYEEQAAGKSALDTIMMARADAFIALLAIQDHPIMGNGSFAIDTNGYKARFVAEHGTADDMQRLALFEMTYGSRTIPAHSHIFCYWMWAGIPGLLPWLYIIYLLAVTLFRRLHVYPPYFGYFALAVPSMFWAIFFSPLGSRINMGFLIAACLVVQTMEREQKRIRIRV